MLTNQRRCTEMCFGYISFLLLVKKMADFKRGEELHRLVAEFYSIDSLNGYQKKAVDSLLDVGIKSTYLGKDPSEDVEIEEGSFRIIYGSPEQIVGSARWRELWRSAVYRDRIVAVVVDEAHTITQWGEAHDNLEPFRSWFGKVGELRSLTSAPMLTLTATASPKHRRQIISKLCMVSPEIIADSPDRPNIKLSVCECKSDSEPDTTFNWLIKKLTEEKKMCPRHVIFCKSISDCARIYGVFRSTCPTIHVEMFHSMTTETVKEKIKMDMACEDGLVRVLVCTNAAGMGVNFKGLHNVIHYGPPQELDTFIQQVGRAGRDGKQSHHLLLYTKRQLRNVDPEMLMYIRNTDICRRSTLTSMYTNTPVCSVEMQHLCCDICEKTCSCSTCSCPMKHDYITEKELDSESHSSSEPMDVSCRVMTPHTTQLLRTALVVYKDSLSVDHTLGLSPDLFHGFTEHVIEQIISSCAMLSSSDDVMKHIYMCVVI